MNKPTTYQNVNFYQAIKSATTGPMPVFFNVLATPTRDYVEGGVPTHSKVETYVLVSTLPTDVQRIVENAVQAVLASKH